MFTNFDKALVGPVVAIMLLLLGGLGVTGDMTVSDVLTLVVTGVLTYFVPNRA